MAELVGLPDALPFRDWLGRAPSERADRWRCERNALVDSNAARGRDAGNQTRLEAYGVVNQMTPSGRDTVSSADDSHSHPRVDSSQSQTPMLLADRVTRAPGTHLAHALLFAFAVAVLTGSLL
jgi:hypothetical protein